MTSILNEAESKANHDAFEIFTSPASIIVFGSLYHLLSSAKLSEYPALEKFFKGFLGTEYAKQAIELASTITAAEKVSPSSVSGATMVAATPGGQNLKRGIFAKKLDGKNMYRPR